MICDFYSKTFNEDTTEKILKFNNIIKFKKFSFLF